MENQSKELKNVLIIRPDVLGDCLLITPAIVSLKKAFPQAKITVLIRPYTKELFNHIPEVDETIEDWFVANKVKSRADYNKYVQFIKSYNFDCSIHFYNELPYAFLAKKAGIKIRIADKAKPLLAPLFTHTEDCRWTDLTLHEVEHNLFLIKPLGLSMPTPPPRMSLVPTLTFQEQLASQYKINENDLVVGIHLGTGKGNKSWSAEYYSQVIDYLVEKHAVKVIITGGEKDKNAESTVLRLCKHKPISLVGKTNLTELISIMSRYNLYISVDTGPLHIASALHLPIVAIFPTKFVDPVRWGPWQTRHQVVRKPVDCELRCFPSTCPLDTCLKQITPSDVILAAEKLLRGESQTQEDLFTASVNVLTNNRSIKEELIKHQTHSVLVNKPRFFDLLKQIQKDDINVIHWTGKTSLKDRSIILLARFIATPIAPIPPLIIYSNETDSWSFNRLIGLYRDRFTSRKYF